MCTNIEIERERERAPRMYAVEMYRYSRLDAGSFRNSPAWVEGKRNWDILGKYRCFVAGFMSHPFSLFSICRLYHFYYYFFFFYLFLVHFFPGTLPRTIHTIEWYDTNTPHMRTRRRLLAAEHHFARKKFIHKVWFYLALFVINFVCSQQSQ